MNVTATATPSPGTLREQMLQHIRRAGHARSARVQQALTTVHRHAFVPEADIETAYADEPVITKRAADGSSLSCASAPTVVAMMLDQLDVQPGQRILEIGAGTGYNAALLACLTGPDGQVTTVDIDPEVTAGARTALNANGYGHVSVITGDGADGAADQAPYDRIIVTAGTWDMPPAWWHQLTPGGRLVVPLRWRAQTRSVAFTLDNDRLTSDSVLLCGFVPMIGHDQDGERSGNIHPDVALHFDTDQPINPDTLPGVLDQPGTTVWSGATVGVGESFDGVWLHLSTQPGSCRIAAEDTAVNAGICAPAIPFRSPALVNGDSLAYFTQRALHGRVPPPLNVDGNSGPAATAPPERTSPNASARRSAPGVLTVPPNPPSPPTPPTGPTTNSPQDI